MWWGNGISTPPSRAKEQILGCDSNKGLYSAVEVGKVPDGRWDIPLSRW